MPQAEHEAELDRKKAAHTAVMERKEVEHKAALDGMGEENTEEKARMVASHEAAMASLKASHEEEVDKEKKRADVAMAGSLRAILDPSHPAPTSSDNTRGHPNPPRELTPPD